MLIGMFAVPEIISGIVSSKHEAVPQTRSAKIALPGFSDPKRCAKAILTGSIAHYNGNMTESREDFEQVCRLTLEDNVVAVASNSPWKTFEDLAAVALESALGTSFQHIPLGGGGQIASTQSGEVHFGVASCANYAPYVESGDVRILVSLRFEAISKLEFKLHRRASHASRAPENGISACDAVTLGHLGIEMLREHVKEDVRIHGILRKH